MAVNLRRAPAKAVAEVLSGAHSSQSDAMIA